MKKGILTSLLVIILVFSLVLTGCIARETSAGEGGVAIYAIWSAPPGVFHPQLFDTYYDGQIVDNVYSGMVRLNPKMEIEADMAESFVVSEDNLTVTYTLRENLKWHDGEPLTIDDIIYTFETIAHPDYTGPRYSDISKILGVPEYKAGEVEAIEGIKVIDERTVSISTSEIYAPALNTIGRKHIIPKHIWEDIPVGEHKDQTDLLRSPVGSGPFKMKEFKPDRHAELIAFDDYHFGRPKLDSLIITVANQQTAQAQIISGQIDFMVVSNLTNEDLKLYSDNDIKVEKIMSSGYQYMGVNNRLDMFEDKRVRQAFMYAINRQGIVDNILEGFGEVSSVPLAPFSWAVPSMDKVNQYPYNTAKAIDLLLDAGFEYKDEKMYFEGQPVELTLKYPPGNDARDRSAPLIQQNLKEIGIDIELKITEFTTMIEEVIMNHDFDLFLMEWGLDVDPGEVMGIWHSSLAEPGGFNIAGFINQKSDELLEKGNSYISLNERLPIFHEWVLHMNEEVPEVFLYSTLEGRAYTPRLKGLQLFPFNDFYDVHNWYLE